MELQTERLLLREFTPSDWPDVYAYQRDPLYLRYTHWSERRPEDVQAFVQMFLAQQEQNPRTKFQLAIVLKSTGHLIGNVGIRMRSIDADSADVGYELGPSHWGLGYATEAARAIVSFGFHSLELHRIWSWCIAENTASARVLEKLGMTFEARLPAKEYFKGRWWDTLVYGMSYDEWRAHITYQGRRNGL